MRKIFAHFISIAIGIVLTTNVFLLQQAGAQAPEKMSYQAVIRDAGNNLVSNQTVGMQISILQGSQEGTEVYIETQTPSTNANGLISIEIGTGTVVSGTFAEIDWENGPFFIKTETDPAGGTDYSIKGTSQLLSVPYAMYANKAGNVPDVSGFITEEADPSVPAGTQVGQMQYWDGAQWITVAAGSEGQILVFTNGLPTWKSMAGVATKGPKDIFSPSTGKIWMDRNLGASQVATSSTDLDAYGDLYQWGRAADGHQRRNSDITSELSSSSTPGHSQFITPITHPYDWMEFQLDYMWQGESGINNPCPEGYRLPSIAEWEAEERGWSSQDTEGAFESPLKLTLGGYRISSTGQINREGEDGYYWSSDISGNQASGKQLHIQFNKITTFRASGYSVRCIKEFDAPQPTTVTNPTTGKTWMDRNLGASQVATSSTDAAAYGDLYQWGRASDGHENRNSGISSLLSSSDAPGHDLFITSAVNPADWRNPQNDNLWQGLNGINNPCPYGFRLPTKAEWDTELQSWSSSNATGAFMSPLKLPMAGYRAPTTGIMDFLGTYGYYWSSSIASTNSWCLYFYSTTAQTLNFVRGHGFSVRCIKD
jgi:uncharacterized protein (TIGR02145 family)